MSLRTKMRLTKKRILSVFLSAALLITMMPASISAAEGYETSVEITEFTADTTFYDDYPSEYQFMGTHAWSLLIHDKEKGGYDISHFSDEDLARIKGGLDGSTLCLDSIAIKIKVSGTVASEFTPYIYAKGMSWSYSDSGNPKNCTETLPKISAPGEYEIVLTIDSSIKDCSTTLMDSGSILITTQEANSATDNPDAVITLESVTFNKAVANAADMTELEAKIAEAKKIVTTSSSTVVANTSKNNYTKASQEALSTEYYAALKITNTNTQDEVDAETQKLTDLINALVSTKDLWDTCNTALSYPEADYTVVSWANLTTAVNNALAIADDASADDVAALKQAITDAIDALELTPAAKFNFTELKKNLDTYSQESEESYTSESWAAFQTVRDNAQAVVDNPSEDLTQDQIDELCQALIDAANALVALDNTAARTELQTVIDQYKDYQEADYTAESWASFQTALNTAQIYSTDETVLIQYINKAKLALQEAAQNLVIAEKIVKEEGVYLDYNGSWKKQSKSNGMTGYVADGSSAVVNATGDWWMDITGLDLSGMEIPTLEVEYVGNGDTLQISYNTTGVSGWNDDNTVITSNKETSGTYRTTLSSDIKYLILTSNGGTLEYTRVKIFDGNIEALATAKNELNTIVSSVDTFNQSDYTAESWEVLEKALEAAKEITDTSTVEEINTAKKALEDAIAGLVKANTSTTPGASTSTPGNNSNNSNNNNNSNATTPLKKGATFTVGQLKYKVTNATSVAVQAPKSKTVKSITIPATVKKNGVTYKVTSVAANAFKNCKKLKKITIGKNVTSIGKNAFKNAKVLKKITVKSTKLKTVGKNALKGIHKKAVVKVPKAKLKKYKKLFKGKGQKKTVKISK